MMGLSVYATGLSSEKSYDCGYTTFGNFRMALASTFDKKYGIYYKRWIGLDFNELTYEKIKLSKEDLADWKRISSEKEPNGDLFIFLSHSDCDDKFTPQECKRIYNIIKDIKMDFMGHNYGEMKPYNMLEQWKGIFLHCWKRRVNLYFR